MFHEMAEGMDFAQKEGEAAAAKNSRAARQVVELSPSLRSKNSLASSTAALLLSFFRFEEKTYRPARPTGTLSLSFLPPGSSCGTVPEV